MTIEKTANIHVEDNIVMILYGRGGVGKTTFAATAPKPLLIDFENGSKYLGERGLNCDVVRMQGWFEKEDLVQLKGLFPQYETIILDPIGEAMEKLIASPSLDGKKYRQADGSLSMAGWGEAKRKMKELVKWLRDAGKNVILIAHVAEGKDGEQTTYRIQIATKLSDELPTMVDIISYMGVRKDAEGKRQCVLYTPAQGGNYDSKDRTGRLPEVVPVSEMHGWEDFKKAMGTEPKKAPVEEKKVEEKPVESAPVKSAPVQAEPSVPKSRIDLEQLLDSYDVQLQGEPYKMVKELLNRDNATDGEYTAMIERCKTYLNRKGVRV